MSTLDASFAALAHPARRAIVQRLSRGTATVTELARPLRVSMPTISRHLNVLEDAGLMVRQKAGRQQLCSLNTKPLREARDWIDDTRRFWQAHFRSLERYLAEVESEGRDAR